MNPQTISLTEFFWRWFVVLTRMIAEISFLTRFGIAFIRQNSLSLLIKKSNVKQNRRFFFLTRRLWNVT
mgnify:FL=1